MTQNNEELLNIKIGKRLKELYKEFDSKQIITSNYLHCHKGTFSRYCSGKEKLPLDYAEKLSIKWGVRKEYILCEDDFKTDEELLSFIEITNHNVFISQKKYLETLGFYITLSYSLLCNDITIYKNKNELLPYLRTDSYNHIISNKIYNLPYNEYLSQNTSSQMQILYLSKPLSDELSKKLTTINKNTLLEKDINSPFGFDGYLLDTTNSFLEHGSYFSIFMTVHYNNKYIGEFSIEEIQKLFKIIDNYTKCSIETFIVKDYELYNDI